MSNILVHSYADVRRDVIYETITRELDEIETLLNLWKESSKLDP